MFAHNRRISATASGLALQNRGRAQAASVQKRREEASLVGAFGQSSFGGANVNIGVSNMGMQQFLLTGIMPDQEEMLFRYYRDIYWYDAVAGSAVDISSSFPFSEWTLTGVDKKQLDKYQESMYRLNLRSLLPEISSSYLVDGRFIGTLIFDSKDKVFLDIMVHSPERARVHPNPFYSLDPTIVVSPSQATSNFMAANDKYSSQFKRLFSSEFLNKLREGALELNPLTTLYVPRKTFPVDGVGTTSYLKRILPIYLFEKQMYRGTLTEAYKRMRAMLHITIGGENWEPTPEEIDAYSQLFASAEAEPLGAVIATKYDVQAAELRQGGDFWKWNDIIDGLVPFKLRALMASEAFLSADATFSNSETAYSVFLENMDAYREYMTYKIFTNKIFPIVAMANEFYREGFSPKKNGGVEDILSFLNNQQGLVLPKINWKKQLSARDEKDPMDLLTSLEEKGFPVTLRMWATAADQDFDSWMQELEKDGKDRAALKAAMTKLGLDESADKMDGEDSQGGDDGEFAALAIDQISKGAADGNEDRLKTALSMLHHINAGRATKRRPLLSRSFEGNEIIGQTRTGKPKAIYSQRAASRAANESIAKAAQKMRDPHHRHVIKMQNRKRFGDVNIFGTR